MPWWSKKSEPKQPAANAENDVYLAPSIDCGGPGYTYHYGLDKTESKLYYCKVSRELYSKSSTIKMKDIAWVGPVEYIEKAPGDVVVCKIDNSNGDIKKGHKTFAYRLQRLESGSIYCERVFSEALITVEHQVWRAPKPTREFVPQGHAEFDRLAVLFDKPTVA